MSSVYRRLSQLLLIGAALLQVSGAAQAQIQRFNDVSSDYWAFQFIETLADSGITSGCGNGNYCPNDPVTRAQMAVFLERGMRGSAYVPPQALGNVFNDVGASDFAAAFIEQFFFDGITSGCGNGNYCAADTVTRAQMAVFLERAIRGSGYVPPAPTGIFNDVGVGDFAAAWIEQLAEDGITGGCGGGNYCPGEPVTRAQMAVFIVRAFDLDGPPARLSSLALIGAALEQTFNPDLRTYSALTGFLASSVLVDATPEDNAATVEINGMPLAPGGVTIELAEGLNDIDIEVTAGDGMTARAYSVTFTRQTAVAFAQDAYIKASNTGSQFGMGDEFGIAVALDGDTLAVGAYLEDSAATGVGGDETDSNAPDSGAVYVFTRDDAGAWSQQAYIKASNTDQFDNFGDSVALSGDTLAVGAVVEASAATGIDGDQADNSTSFAGAVYVFTRDGAGTWSQQAYVKASNTESGDSFGKAVALTGDTLAVGAWVEDSASTGIDGNEADNSASDSGAVYVFTRDGAGAWSQQAYLKTSNTEASDLFGSSIALDGDTLAVGAKGESSAAMGVGGDEADNSASGSGAVYVFTRDGAGTWSQQAYVKASNTESGDSFGEAVALAGDTLAVGALLEDSASTGIDGNEADNSASDSGAVYVFTRDGAGAWSQQAYLKTSNTDVADGFGGSLALAGNSLAVGTESEDSAATGLNGDQSDNSATFAGAVYLFTRDGAGTWSQQAYVKASNTDARDRFGRALALDGDTLAVGAKGESSAAMGVGGDEADNTALETGAVYLYGGVPARNAAITSLELEDVAFDQIFDPAQPIYTASTRFLRASIRLNATADDPLAIVRVNGVRIGNEGLDLPLAEGVNEFTVEVTAEDGVTMTSYTLTVTRASVATFAQRAYIKASNTEADDIFGLAVALAGDTLAVGAYLEDSAATGVGGDETDSNAPDSGAVYVFTRDGAGVWSQQAYIKASNTDTGDNFGFSVALAGDTLAVGAWQEGSAATVVGGDEADNGAPGAGAVYIFTRDMSGIWSQQDYIKASNAESNDNFGRSVALADDTLAVSAWLEDSASTGIGGSTGNSAMNSGAVYIFTRDLAGTWSQQAYVKASNTGAEDLFGVELALDGDTLAVGAHREDSASTGIDGSSGDSATNSGAVYVFNRNSLDAWSQQAYVKASNTGVGDRFGIALALYGNTLAVGAYLEDSASTGIDGSTGNSATNSGAVYIFTRDLASTWSQQAYVKASNTGAEDRFGVELALDGDTLAVGAHREDSAATGVGGNESDNTAGNAGAVYVFTRNAGGTWSQVAYVKASNSDTNDEFGFDVALSADSLAIGVRLEDSAASGVGGDEADNAAADSGAVYIFD